MKKIIMTVLIVALVVTTTACGKAKTDIPGIDLTDSVTDEINTEDVSTSTNEAIDASTEAAVDEIVNGDTTDVADISNNRNTESVSADSNNVTNSKSTSGSKASSTKAANNNTGNNTASSGTSGSSKTATTSKPAATTPTTTKAPAQQNTTTKASQQTTTKASEQKTTSHSHDWKEVYKTVHHDEVGHTETVTVQAAWDEEVKEAVVVCNGCGKVFTAGEYGSGNAAVNAWTLHVWTECSNPVGSYHADTRVVDTIHHEAVTEQKYIVDQKAYDEKVLDHYECSTCGATKK